MTIGKNASSNLLHGQTFYDQVVNATDMLYDYLEQVCGPYAEFSVVPTRDVNTYYHVYTKDGINTLKQIKFDNRAFEHVRHLATYIGSRVDSTCHDGTTTSMMLFLSLLRNSLSLKNNISTMPNEAAMYRRLMHLFKDELMRLRAAVDASTTTTNSHMFSPVPHKDVVDYIAYHHALMSSKGNKELAGAVADVVSHLPPELYGQYTLNRTSQETAKEFDVIQQNHDLSATASFPIAALYNKYMKTQYVGDDVYVLPIDPETLDNENTPEREKMVNFLSRAMVENTSHEDLLDRDLVLITTDLNKGVLDRINQFNKIYEHKIVPIELMQTNTQMFVHIIEAIRCVSGMPSLGDQSVKTVEDALIPSENVTFANNTVFLKGLYTKTGETYHPFYENPDLHPPYTQLVTEMRNTIQEFENSAKPDEGLKHAMIVIIPLYRQIVCQTIWDLKIGGPLHDHLANHATVQDAFGAATSGVENGFIIGGLHRILATYVKGMKAFNSDSDNVDEALTDIRGEIQEIIFNSIEHILEITYRVSLSSLNTGRSKENQRGQRLLRHLQEDETGYVHLDLDNQSLQTASMPGDLWSFLPHEDHEEFVVEPAQKYKELIDRLLEVLPKMIGTSTLIDVEDISGGATHG